MRYWFGKALQVCSATALLLLPATQSHAIVASIKHMGMATTGCACPQDALSAAYNPANAMFVGNRVDVGVSWFKTEGEADISGNRLNLFGIPGVNGHHKSSRHPNSFDPEMGINYMVCGSCDFALGLIAYNKGYLQSDYNPIHLYGTSHLGLESIQECVAPVAALRYDNFSIGVALQIMAQRFTAHGLENFDNALFSSVPGKVTNRGHDYSYGVGVMVGGIWEPLCGLKVGVAWEPKTRMGRLKKYAGLLEGHGRLDIPERFTGGVGFELMPCMNVCADFQYVRWSRVKALGNANPTTLVGVIANPLGTTPGFGWRDQPVGRIGVDYLLCDWNLTLRAGYRYARTPIRNTATFVNFLTSVEAIENFVTVGFSWVPWDCTEISFYYLHGFKKTIKDKKGIDNRVLFVPTPITLGGGTLDISNSANAAGISFGVMF